MVISKIEMDQFTTDIVFFGNQTIVSFGRSKPKIYIYDALKGVELYKEELPASTGIEPKNYWAHKGSLQFASCFDEDEKYVVSILELQSTSNLPVHVVKSFTAPPDTDNFSFSPVSSHASFVDFRKLVILNFQDSRILLQFRAAHPLNTRSGCFSPDGHFFACSNQENEILVWENTSTGYVNCSTITP